MGSDKKMPVRILRDTGVLDSFIRQPIFPFSPDSDTGEMVLVRKRGMGLKVLSAPLHRVEFVSDLVQGEVCMGVCPQLPVYGVDIILGNDLAGDWVWADGKPPNVVTQLPSVLQKCAIPECPGVVSAFPDMQTINLPTSQNSQKRIHDTVVPSDMGASCEGEEDLATVDAILRVGLEESEPALKDLLEAQANIVCLQTVLMFFM